MFKIDLLMPITCHDCGYQCCAKIKESYDCFRPFWSSDYCTRQTRANCKSHPLMYFNSKFSIGCLYFEENPESIPEELIEVVEILNELKEHIDSFHYQSKEIEVSVQLLKPKEQESDLPLHEVLRLSDLGSLCRHPKCLLTDKSFFDSCGGFG